MADVKIENARLTTQAALTGATRPSAMRRARGEDWGSRWGNHSPSHGRCSAPSQATGQLAQRRPKSRRGSPSDRCQEAHNPCAASPSHCRSHNTENRHDLRLQKFQSLFVNQSQNGGWPSVATNPPRPSSINLAHIGAEFANLGLTQPYRMRDEAVLQDERLGCGIRPRGASPTAKCGKECVGGTCRRGTKSPFYRAGVGGSRLFWSIHP
jgi:hypothetical protein